MPMVSEEFLAHIKTLTVMELGMMARELRKDPQDKEFLHAVLTEVGKRDLTDPYMEWIKVNG